MQHEQESPAGDDRQTIRRGNGRQLSNGAQLARGSLSARCGAKALAGRGVLGSPGGGTQDGAPKARTKAKGEQERQAKMSLRKEDLIKQCPACNGTCWIEDPPRDSNQGSYGVRRVGSYRESCTVCRQTGEVLTEEGEAIASVILLMKRQGQI
jgi:hypothetical protein